MTRAVGLIVLSCAAGCGPGPSPSSGTPIPPGPCATPDVDGDGQVSVACGGDDCNDLNAQVHPGASEWLWRTESVVTEPSELYDDLGAVAFGVDRDGAPWTVYESYTEGSSVHYVIGAGDSTADDVIGSSIDSGGQIAGALGPDGTAVVAFEQPGEAPGSGRHTYVAVRNGSHWQIDRITNGHASGLAVAVDRQSTIVVLVSGRDGLEAYAGAAGSLDGPVPIDPEGEAPSIAMAPDGTRHAVWISGTDVVYGASWGGPWSIETVRNLSLREDAARRDIVSAPSVTVDDRGVVHLVWWESQNGIVHAARSDAWRLETLPFAGASPRVASAGQRIAIAYDATEGGQPTIWLAMPEEGAWSTEPTTSGELRGLALGRDGGIHLLAFTQAFDPEEPMTVLSFEYTTNDSRDGVDSDCDGRDEVMACVYDDDGDGDMAWECGGADCDDADPGMHPGMSDVLGDGIDADCNGADGTDRDHDGAVGTASGGPDCDDLDPLFGPQADDPSRDCVDQNCDGVGGIDDDGDGQKSYGCGGLDCDDGDPDAYHNAPDLLGDGVDQDCGGEDGVDWDHDGFVSVESGGDDCLDRMADVHPGAPDGAPGWRTETIGGPTATADDATSLAIDPHGWPVIAHHALEPDRVLLEHEVAGGWASELVDGVGPGPAFPSLVLDALGLADVLYRKDGSDDLRHATNVSGAWETESVDAVGRPGLFVAAVRDPAGALHAVYVDSAERDTLQYATNASGVWVLETVDGDGATGHDCSIALDPSGAVHVAYAEVGNEDLRHATNASGAWATETIDDGPARGHHSAIAVDANGAAHIAYREGGHEAPVDSTLWYATNVTGTWTFEVVDDDFGAGFDSSIALDAEGFVHVSEVADGQLRVASNASGAWQVVSIVRAECSATSLAIDLLGREHVSYFDGVQGLLGYATDAAAADGLDQNCDGVDGVDADGDGHASVMSAGDDCDDAASDVHPDAADPPGDGTDANCDGLD